jgi:hypothetical protein
LKGTCVNGLVFNRRLELAGDAPVLRTFTTLTNRYNLPVTAVLQSRAEVNPGDHEHPTVDLEFSDVGGQAVRRPLLPQVGQYFGIEAYLAGNHPAGEWRAVNRGVGMTLKNRFSLDQVPRCRLWWRGRGENKVNLSLWSEKKDLRAGESLRLDAEYVVE